MPIEIHTAKAAVKDKNNNWHRIDAFSESSNKTLEAFTQTIQTLSKDASNVINDLRNNTYENLRDLLPENYDIKIQQWQLMPLTLEENCFLRYRPYNPSGSDPYSANNPLDITQLNHNKDYDCAIISPKDSNGSLAGEVFLINGYSAEYARAWFFLDENKGVIANEFDETGKYLQYGFSIENKGHVINQWIVGPIGAKFLILNNRKSEWDEATYGKAICYHKINPYDMLTHHEQVINTLQLPSYWQEALESVRAKIIKRDLALSNDSTTKAYGDRFFFITDPHFRAQKNKMSSRIIDALAAEFNINLCLLGGDNIASDVSSPEEEYQEISQYISSFKNPKLRLFATAGNHDIPAASPVNKVQLYNMLMRQMEEFATTTGNIDAAYYDNVDRKIRYIQFYNTSLNGCYNQTIANWVENACTVGQDWTIVVMSHSYWGGSNIPDNSSKWANKLLFLKQKGAPIALWLVGHTHLDKYTCLSQTNEVTGDETKLLVVCTTTDNVSSGQTGKYRQDNTDTESAFDIVHLDTLMHKVYFTRVGAWWTGSADSNQLTSGDRAFDYETGESIPYQT